MIRLGENEASKGRDRMENTYSLFRFCPYYYRNKAMAIKSNKRG